MRPWPGLEIGLLVTRLLWSAPADKRRFLIAWIRKAKAQPMQNKLPPLNALRAFEAGARHLSFTKAAEELPVTQAAVSHQVTALEEHPGSPLFTRLTRTLGLTAPGRARFPGGSEAFPRI